MKWDSVCLDKDYSSLGIVDLELKNKSLLNKWIWRYGMKEIVALELDSHWYFGHFTYESVNRMHFTKISRDNHLSRQY